MASLVTSVIGGIQGASAAHNAATALANGFTQAQGTYANARDNSNQVIGGSAANAQNLVTGAASDAGAGVTQAAGRSITRMGTATANGMASTVRSEEAHV